MQTVRDIMTANPACCTSDTRLEEVAQMMVDNCCGEIPVIDSERTRTPIGVVTDRDIVCRVVAQGKDARALSAKDCMTFPCLTIGADKSLDECCRLLESTLIRRVPVVDERGVCCGIVAQADIARARPVPAEPSHQSRV